MFSFLKKISLVLLMLGLMGLSALNPISAEAHGITSPGGHDECVIPDSGPWPPCATGGTTPPAGSGDECVIPDSGPWPPCATGGGSTPAPAPGGSGDCVIPDSGPWPPCATGGGGGAPAPAPGGSGDCVIPDSGPWPPCATAGGGGAQGGLDARINAGLQQLETYWAGELTWRGITPPELQGFTIYEGDPDDPPNAFYVLAEDAIYVDQRLLDLYVAEFGEYAAVAIIAHEYAHFIQDSLGLLIPSTPVRTIELQADCLTGSFTGYLNSIGALRPGEFEAGSDMFFASGDDQLSDSAVPIWVQHGTGEERSSSYEMGYFGTAQTCFEAVY